ncbi:bile acid:sodium symporter family protein [Terrisporobacter sp.]|uniref:bile acid:sodium symporter family protein n=1 Tax=Terrisporobacter sp. TaxID=1965305 RepID=UPI002ED4F5A4
MDIDISHINNNKKDNKNIKLKENLGGNIIMKTLEKLSNFASKYMAFIVLAFAGLSVLIPSTFEFASPHVNTCLGVIMFGMGMTLRLEDFRLVLTRPKDVLSGSLAQFTVMPSVAFLVAKLLNLPTEMAVGLILVGCCPGGASSNVMSFMAKGDVALSVTLTSISTLLAPFLTPALTLLLGGSSIEVSLASMCTSILQVVLVPIVLGLLCNKFLPRVVEEGTKLVPLLSTVCLVLIIGSIVGTNVDSLLSSGLLILVAVMIHNTVGYLLGYMVAKKLGLEEAKRRTISIEVGLQNGGLATSLAMTHFSPMTAIPGVVSSTYHAVSGAMLANFWANKPLDKEESIKKELVGREVNV